ncbi:uracil-DNA glycosylase, partial [Achromobacter xylosoxidans]|nr:uracil-DNA glycosylase [Achromobacter xylosoxidans]
MTAPNPTQSAAAPRVNPLQRLWLRELGMERLWLRPAPRPAVASEAQAVVSKQDSPAMATPGGAPPAPVRDAAPAPTA